MNAQLVCPPLPPGSNTSSASRISASSGGEPTPTCRVVTNFAELESLRDEWDRFAIARGAPIYMSFDWARVWWRFYGGQRPLRVFVFRDGPALAAIVPIYLDDLGLGPFGLRVARLVGANIPPKVFDPPVADAHAEKVWDAVIRHLLTQDRCDVLSLGPVSDEYLPAKALASAASRLSEICLPPESSREDVHTFYRLPASFDDYINSLDPKERKTRRRKLRDLDELGSAVSSTVRAPDEVGAQFEEFVRDHTAQWQAERRPGHFYSWPDALAYNRELVRVQGQLGRVRFYRLACGERCVANQYAFAFGRRLYAELPCRAYGPEWERLSLGGSSQIKLIESAIEEGFDHLESGLGHYPYKLLTGGKESAVRTFRVTNRSRWTTLRLPLYRAYAKGVQMLVLKLWYRRLAPRLPLRLRSGQPRFALDAEI